MADKKIGVLSETFQITNKDMFLLEQNGEAKKLSGNTLKNYLENFTSLERIAEIQQAGQDILNSVKSAKDNAVKAVDDAKTSIASEQTTAINAINQEKTDATNLIDQKKQQLIDDLPDDYMTLENRVNTFASELNELVGISEQDKKQAVREWLNDNPIQGSDVSTVNGVSPDSNGNVQLTPQDIGISEYLTNEDLTAYDTSHRAEVDATIESKIVQSAFTHPNLLDNWYFGNPVNQRGNTSFTANGYWIDRWISGDGFKSEVMSDCCRLTKVKATNTNAFIQKVDNVNALVGKDLTFSLLYRGTGHPSISIAFGSQNSDTKQFDVSTEWNIATFIFSVPDDATVLNPYIYPDNTDDLNYIDILATKLELGEGQTLAHQDESGNWVLNEIPDYGEELRKCQRYFFKASNDPIGFGFTGDSGTVWLGIVVPVEMRAKPSISFATPSESMKVFSNTLTNVPLANFAVSDIRRNIVEIKSSSTISSKNMAASAWCGTYVYLSADL